MALFNLLKSVQLLRSINDGDGGKAKGIDATTEILDWVYGFTMKSVDADGRSVVRISEQDHRIIGS